MTDPEPSLLQGFLWCISDSEAIRLQTSRWKRKLLVFLSMICLGISGVPYLFDWLEIASTGPKWLVPALFGIRAAEAVIYFRGLTLAYLPALYTIIPLSLLIYHFKSPKWVGILGLLQVLVVIGGNLVFTPLFGLSGPVGALGLANTLVLFLSLYIVKRS